MKTIVLTGGGTAGHVMPHLALLADLQKNFDKIIYIGSHTGIENTIIKENTLLEYYPITTTKLHRSISLKNLCIPFKLLRGISEAKKILKKNNVNIVFSKGGFVSVPVVLACRKLKIPVVSHESDITLGLANKIIRGRSSAMCVSFQKTLKQIKHGGVYTGSPIRADIFKGNKERILKLHKLDNKKPTILFVGGSLGAKVINEEVFKTAIKLSKKYNILHLTGKNKVNKALLSIKNYIQVDFTNTIEDYYDLADLVISRAGSNVIFELLALKKPMLLIPLSKKASRGDQILNADYFKQKGYARVLYEENLTEKSLMLKIAQTLKSKHTLVSAMRANNFAVGNINIIEQILKHTKTDGNDFNLHLK
jgi:UDP-N-acetylglucosamine--N-acetylmuramyl-(pentapeptide) pyrophosphoryl-undecaprenol N-acetylglucosamine transferase